MNHEYVPFVLVPRETLQIEAHQANNNNKVTQSWQLLKDVKSVFHYNTSTEMRTCSVVCVNRKTAEAGDV